MIFFFHFPFRVRFTICPGKDQKRVQKSVAESQENQATSQDLSDGITRESLKAALNEIRNEVGPRTPEEQESYFMVQIGMGEQLVQGGASLQDLLNCFDANFLYLQGPCITSKLPSVTSRRYVLIPCRWI